MSYEDKLLQSNEPKEPNDDEHCPHCGDGSGKQSRDYGYNKYSSNVNQGTPGHVGEQEYFPALSHDDSDSEAYEDTYVEDEDQNETTDGAKENNSYE